MAQLEFADVSSNNSSVDLQKYAAAGYHRIAIKATQGVNYLNPYFPALWQQAKSLGLERWAYHFATADATGAEQADFFLSRVDRNGQWTPVLDIEWQPDGYTPWNGRTQAVLSSFCAEIERRTGMRGYIYSGAGFFPGLVLPAGWKTWVADYGARPQMHWDAWQYTDTKDTPGIGSCDASYYEVELAQPSPAPVQEDDDMSFAIRCTDKTEYPQTLVEFGGHVFGIDSVQALTAFEQSGVKMATIDPATFKQFLDKLDK